VIALLQRGVMLLAAVAALLWAAYWAAHGEWLMAVAGALVPLLLQPAVLAVEFFLMLPATNRADTAPRPSGRQLATAWWRESLTTYTVFNWRQPFLAGAEPDHLEGSLQGRRALVLVHGFFCNRGLWNPWMQRLRRDGVPFAAITLEPAFGGIDDYVPLIDAVVARAHSVTGVPPLIVGHSMGGIAVRAWLRAQGDAGDSRIAGVITIGSPHAGTFTARFSRAANARQMRLDSEWLTALASVETAERRAMFTCFYSHCDNIVMPASNAAMAGAVNRHVEGEPHVALAFAPQVFDEVLKRVRTSPLSAQ
jgi:triacylglycerol lipase